MKIKTHLRVAKIAAREYALARRAAVAFYFGTMVPDLLPFYHPHYFKTSGNYVFNKLGKLAKKHSIYSFFWRGVMAHYVTDFCCTAHQNGLGNPGEHIAYERALERYTREHVEELKEVYKKREPVSDLHEVLNTYIGGEKNNFENDFCSAIQGCVALLGCYTPVVDVRKRALAFDFNFATPNIDALTKVLTDAINEALQDVIKTNKGSIN